MSPKVERVDCREVAERPLAKGPHYVHPNARYSDSCSEGCCDFYECPDCGVNFRVEF